MQYSGSKTNTVGSLLTLISHYISSVHFWNLVTRQELQEMKSNEKGLQKLKEAVQYLSIRLDGLILQATVPSAGIDLFL